MLIGKPYFVLSIVVRDLLEGLQYRARTPPAMAKTDDLELGTEPEAGSNKKKLIIIAGAAALLLILGGVAAWLLLGGEDEPAPAEQVEQQAPPAEQGEVAYQDLGPVFVVSLTGNVRMLQVGLQVRMRYPALGEFLKHNDPALRHAILNLLGTQDAEALKTREGKEQLREALKAAINGLVQKYRGPGEIEEVLYSSFVMQ